ncbi:hypothetical protein Q9L58_010613 [Maublancomyces gigas]|uniref:Uncharacterized protein n=1 Tax=Discina gigas TaxID=1032678 RepID=A0ABR3G3M4_9PEZI
MAFEPSLHTLALAADIAGISERYLHASLLAASVACIEQQQAEWWASSVMPDESVWREVEAFACDEDPDTPETAATYLLLVLACLAIWFVAPEELAEIDEPLCATLRRAPGRQLKTAEATAIWHLLEAAFCRDHKADILASR